jgi:hypothetical protein
VHKFLLLLTSLERLGAALFPFEILFDVPQRKASVFRISAFTKKFPVFSTDKQLICWNIPYLNLDKLPVLDLTKSPKLERLTPHIGLTFSDCEIAIRLKETHIGEDWLLGAKESI